MSALMRRTFRTYVIQYNVSSIKILWYVYSCIKTKMEKYHQENMHCLSVYAYKFITEMQNTTLQSLRISIKPMA